MTTEINTVLQSYCLLLVYVSAFYCKIKKCNEEEGKSFFVILPQGR